MFYFDGRVQIRIIELILDIPAYRPELLSFLNDRMEEAEPKEKRLPALAQIELPLEVEEL